MEKIHFYSGIYHANMKITQGGGRSSEQEDIELIEYNYSEIPTLLQSGQIIDAKTIILLQWAMSALM